MVKIIASLGDQTGRDNYITSAAEKRVVCRYVVDPSWKLKKRIVCRYVVDPSWKLKKKFLGRTSRQLHIVTTRTA
jgi:hypothetical protein